MQEIKTKKSDAAEVLFQMKVDDDVLDFRQPKDAILARVIGIYSSKYTPFGVQIQATFEFLQAALTLESWNVVANRINDPEDDLDMEVIGELFEAILDNYKEAGVLDGEPQKTGPKQVRRASKAV